MLHVSSATDDAFQDALLALFQMHGEVIRTGDVMAASFGLTGARWHVLRAAARQPMTVSQAARRLGLKRQSVQRTVDQLVAEGMAELRQNRDHQRAPLVVLSAKGEAVLAKLEERRHDWVARVLRGFPRERLAELVQTLNELAGRLGKATTHYTEDAT
ncbi:MAG: MarR family transcriptional regulator [Gammaproteobacteria bacterium]|nr:MarR family transcriptional regulator [Gammaproteobacteria bacterium]